MFISQRGGATARQTKRSNKKGVRLVRTPFVATARCSGAITSPVYEIFLRRIGDFKTIKQYLSNQATFSIPVLGLSRRSRVSEAKWNEAERYLFISQRGGATARQTKKEQQKRGAPCAYSFCCDRSVQPCGLAPRVGFEPTTLRLTAGCSAAELTRNIQLPLYPNTCNAVCQLFLHKFLLVHSKRAFARCVLPARPLISAEVCRVCEFT